MKVMKFGGTSVGTPQRIKNIASLITKSEESTFVVLLKSPITYIRKILMVQMKLSIILKINISTISMNCIRQVNIRKKCIIF